MVKRKSLRYQFKIAIYKAFKPKTSKRLLKERAKKCKDKNSLEYLESVAIITSYNYRDSLFDLVDKFINWLKYSGQYSDFRYAYEIDSYVWVDFLRYLRFERGYNYRSIKNVTSRIRKLERVMRYIYQNSEFDFTSQLDSFLKRLKKDDKVRIHCLSIEDWKKLLSYLAGIPNPKPWELGLLIQSAFGLRSYEVPRLRFVDIMDYEGVIAKIHDIWKEREAKGLPKQKFYIVKSPYDRYIAVRGKGGQWRFVPALTKFQYQILEYLLERKEDDMALICECSTSKMRRELKKILVERLGLEKFRRVPCSTHMVRKTYSRFSYQFLIKNKDKIERVVVAPE
jgi:integrase